jgi:chromosome segregation ATPase
MKHVLKALDNQLKLIKEDLDWHKHEYNVYKDKSFEQSKEIKNLREEKEVLMKRIQELQDVIQTIKEEYKNK